MKLWIKIEQHVLNLLIKNVFFLDQIKKCLTGLFEKKITSR